MDFNDLILKRRSVRSFIKKEIPDNIIFDAINDSVNCPSWKNSQVSRFYLISSIEAINKIQNALPEFNQESSLNAKLVITTYVNNRSGFSKETGLAESELGNGFGLYDLGLNNAYFVLALKNRGLDSLIMGIRNEELLRNICNIPSTETIVSVIAVGYSDLVHLRPKKKNANEITKII